MSQSTHLYNTHTINTNNGETFVMDIEFWDNEAETIPTTITGTTFHAQLLPDGCGDTPSVTPIAAFTNGSGLSITAPNKLGWVIPYATMATLEGKYRWKLWQVLSGGTIVAHFAGSFNVAKF